MVFSYNAVDTLRRVADGDSISTIGNLYDTISYAKIALCFDVKDGCEVPKYCIYNILSMQPENCLEIYAPLTVDNFIKPCGGAETMLRHFVRGYSGYRLLTAENSKGERYYGNKGIILDKDFTPLLLATAKVTKVNDTEYKFTDDTIYLHPKVFTDDTGFLNKYLAKKGTAFYLLHPIRWNPGEEVRAEVKIKDCSHFIRKVKTPIPQTATKDKIYELLRSNIGDILSQLKYD